MRPILRGQVAGSVTVRNGTSSRFRSLTGFSGGPGSGADWWVGPVQRVALLVWLSIPVVGFAFPDQAGALTWRVVIVSLPLFIVVAGYHRWRRICPLSMFTKAPAALRRPGKRRASKWFQANYYYVTFGVFSVCLWLRLAVTNVDARAMAVFFIILSLSALAVGALFTGKTWCNYICPLSFIEKVYTEPNGLRETANSQCGKCTACKPACPDINEENAFWKEVDSEPKRYVYYAFPGLVLGFFFYSYLQSGSWASFFAGASAWSQPQGGFVDSFKPGTSGANGGFSFAHGLPIAVAAALTLAVAAVASVVVFRLVEQGLAAWLKRREPDADAARFRSLMFALAAFAAFVIFYGFAGYPSISGLPWLQDVLRMLAVATATLFLVRRLRRTRQDFAEETVGRNIIKQWEWADRPPRDLHDAFLVHTIRSTERQSGRQRVVKAYEDAIRETVASGVLTREEVDVIDSMRQQLGLTAKEHDGVMATLAEEERTALRQAQVAPSLEKRLQLESYRRALGAYVEGGRANSLTGADAKAIRRLQNEYGVTQPEHLQMLNELLGGSEETITRLAATVTRIEQASQAIEALAAPPDIRHKFLRELLKRRRVKEVSTLVSELRLTGVGLAGWLPAKELGAEEAVRRREALQMIGEWASRSVGDALVAAHDQANSGDQPARLANLAEDTDPYIREAARLALRKGLVPEEMTPIERMGWLWSLPLFATVATEGLADLAGASRTERLAAGANLWREGDEAVETVALVEGRVSIAGGGEVRSVEASGGQAVQLGELVLFEPLVRSATVVVVDASAVVLRLKGDAFSEAMQRDPSIAERVIQDLARRQTPTPQGGG